MKVATSSIKCSGPVDLLNNGIELRKTSSKVREEGQSQRTKNNGESIKKSW